MRDILTHLLGKFMWKSHGQGGSVFAIEDNAGQAINDQVAEAGLDTAQQGTDAIDQAYNKIESANTGRAH